MIDHHEAVGRPVEQVDVALVQTVADRGAGVHLPPMRRPGRRLDDRRAERVLHEPADVLGAIGHRLCLALCGHGVIETGPAARSIVCSTPCTARPTAVP